MAPSSSRVGVICANTVGPLVLGTIFTIKGTIENVESGIFGQKIQFFGRGHKQSYKLGFFKRE